jgi:hypothetical protein
MIQEIVGTINNFNTKMSGHRFWLVKDNEPFRSMSNGLSFYYTIVG